MRTQFDGIVVHGSGLTPDLELNVKGAQRMDTGIALWNQGVAEHMAVSGGYSFMLDTPPAITESVAMTQYGVDHGVPRDAIYPEHKSLDTIGNALFTKTDIVLPNDWESLMVVTSESHLPRTLNIFRHVLGSDFEVEGTPAPEHVTARERIYEVVGLLMMKEILRGTKPGDHEAIQERLFDLVPGYADGTKKRLAIQSMLGLLRPRTIRG